MFFFVQELTRYDIWLLLPSPGNGKRFRVQKTFQVDNAIEMYKLKIATATVNTKI